MKEFKKIESQEELNQVIAERLNREREKYSDYEELKATNAKLTEELSKYSDYEKITKDNKTLSEQIQELNVKLQDYDVKKQEHESLSKTLENYKLKDIKIKFALEHGIPYTLAERLSGTTEEEIQADAQNISAFFKTQSVPLKNTETQHQKDGYIELLNELKGK